MFLPVIVQMSDSLKRKAEDEKALDDQDRPAKKQHSDAKEEKSLDYYKHRSEVWRGRYDAAREAVSILWGIASKHHISSDDWQDKFTDRDICPNCYVYTIDDEDDDKDEDSKFCNCCRRCWAEDPDDCKCKRCPDCKSHEDEECKEGCTYIETREREAYVAEWGSPSAPNGRVVSLGETDMKKADDLTGWIVRQAIRGHKGTPYEKELYSNMHALIDEHASEMTREEHDRLVWNDLHGGNDFREVLAKLADKGAVKLSPAAAMPTDMQNWWKSSTCPHA
jgi:hypothetical protein